MLMRACITLTNKCMRKKENSEVPRNRNACTAMLNKQKLVYLLLALFLCVPEMVCAQQRTKVTFDLKNVTVETVIDEIKKQTDYDFIYNKEIFLPPRKFSIKAKAQEAKALLSELMPKFNVEFSIKGNVITLRSKGPAKSEDGREPITGKVIDEENGDPLVGVSMMVQGTSIATTTDMDGNFTIRARGDDILRLSYIGYQEELFRVNNKKQVLVRMRSSAQKLEEVTVVAFGTQKKESVVSAITTVRPAELRSSNSDLTASFAGKIPGVVGWQTGGIPGALSEDEMNTKFYIRGITSFQTGANIDPLILIDNVESSKVDLARLNPDDIESFSVMKDASATAMYGARGANGVILVTTKKGEEGSVYTSVRYEVIRSQPTSDIDVVDPVTYMKMYNQAYLSRNPGATPTYSVERINRTGDPRFPSFVYPANNWYDILFKDYNINHHVGVNIRGGSKVMQYYASVNYNKDMGMLKTDRLNQFDVNINNNTLSARVNLNADLKPGIRLLVNTALNWDKYHGPLVSVTEAYGMAFQANPVAFAPTYPADDTYSWPHIRFGNTSSGNDTNPYMSLHSGYRERDRFSMTARVEYIHNLSALIKGLELRGSVSLQKIGLYDTPYETKPYVYALQDYNEQTGKHTLLAIDPEKSDRTLTTGETTSQQETQVMYEVRGYHTAAWNDHQTSLTAVFNAMERTQTVDEGTSVLDAVANRNMGFSMRGTYGYKDRYFIEASFGYNGSERFAKHNRFGFFPAGGLAWVVSEEKFMQSLQPTISFLKLRASYGKVGNDGIIDKPRFVYMPSIATGTTYNPNPGEMTVPFYHVENEANPDIQWEVGEQANLGLELKMFGGIFEMTLDAYQEIRHNILSYRYAVPSHVGLGNYTYLQLDNVGSARSRGIDFSGKIQHAFNKDTWLILSGTLTYNKTVYKELEESPDTPEWQQKVGHEISQQIGYIAEGLFQSQEEIDNAPFHSGNTQPGDIRYRDVNGDGTIDVNDAVHIGLPETPRIIYGLSGSFNHKGWEFNFSFQGSGQRGFFINPASISPFYSGTMLTAIAEDHWSEDNMKTRPFWPRLSTNSIIYNNPMENYYNINYGNEVYKSTYFMRTCRFLRCTALELAYNFPETWNRKLGMQNVKFFVRANNPFMISDFKLWDVELGEDGFNYPIQKTYSLGFNLSF